MTVKCENCDRDDTYVYYVGADKTLCQDCELIAALVKNQHLVPPVEIVTNSGLVSG